MTLKKDYFIPDPKFSHMHARSYTLFCFTRITLLIKNSTKIRRDANISKRFFVFSRGNWLQKFFE